MIETSRFFPFVDDVESACIRVLTLLELLDFLWRCGSEMRCATNVSRGYTTLGEARVSNGSGEKWVWDVRITENPAQSSR